MSLSFMSKHVFKLVLQKSKNKKPILSGNPQLGSPFQDASMEFLSLILRRNLSCTMLTLPFHALFYGKELKIMYIAFGNMDPGKPTCFSIPLVLDIYEQNGQKRCRTSSNFLIPLYMSIQLPKSRGN